MDLILQAAPENNPGRGIIEAIAAMAGARTLRACTPFSWRCGEISVSSVVTAAIHASAFAAGLDAAFVESGQRLDDFKLLVMDMDSTLITIECIDEIADLQGLKPQVAAITEATMRGELDFKTSLVRRVALLKGLDAGALQQVIDERLALSPGAETLLTAVRQAGLKTLLVSGGFTFFTDRLQTRLGLDFSRANQLEIINGTLSGKVLGDIIDADAKQHMVETTCAQLGIAPAQTIVVGDGANDLKMMAIAGISVAFRAKPVVQEKADVALNFVGLDGILMLFHQAAS